jgi:hypothetical protein
MPTDFQSINVTALVALIAAVGAFGTAAFGLVDATKAFGGGIANVGFGFLRKALDPYAPALSAAVGDDWPTIIQSHWRNGKPKDEQKAIATALIQLGLSPDTAEGLAREGHVDPAALRQAVEKMMRGDELDPLEINVLSRFKTSVEAKMDAAFERAEQAYRNWARLAAGVVAMVLAMIAGGLLFADRHAPFLLSAYLQSDIFKKSLLVGLVAVPVAPITKDLISSLSAAVRAAKAARL